MFQPEEKRRQSGKRKSWSDVGILSEARDWVVLADLGRQLKCPAEIANTRLRPDVSLSRELFGGSTPVPQRKGSVLHMNTSLTDMLISKWTAKSMGGLALTWLLR